MTMAHRPVLDHHVGEDRDERNRDYSVRRLLSAPRLSPAPRMWTPGTHLRDPGQTGHCGGFAAANEAQASPVRVTGIDNAYAHGFYYEIKDRGWDPWAREDGTSTQAVMRLHQARGLSRAYAWAFALPELLLAFQVGPVLCGTWWKDGMFDPNGDGVIHTTGSNAGGHLWLATGWSANYRGPSGRTYGPCLRGFQSWGEWGLHGRFYLPLDEAQHLLFADDGEAGVPTDRSFPAP
jgi:hypothetical protein